MPRQTPSRRARAEIAQHGFEERQRKPGPWKEMNSSRVARARYDSGTRQVQVVFANNDAPYVYEEVPQNIWRNFRRSTSPGRYINRTLNAFPYYRSPASFEDMDEALAEQQS
jgi:hypothetical protein